MVATSVPAPAAENHTQTQAEAPLPSRWVPLRQELHLSQGPVSDHGGPTWTVHDPAAHRFYRIGWLEFEILSRWSLGSADAIRDALSRETTLNASVASIQAVYDFALRNNLLVASTQEDTDRLLVQKQMRQTSWVHKVLHGYLFLRIPLVTPDAWLQRHIHWVKWMFSSRFLIGLFFAAALGLYLVGREWVLFLIQLKNVWSWQHSLIALVALGLTKTVHELGHAFAAKHLHLRVPRMGVALMCFAPVLWTDVTEAWKLPRRSDRLLVDMSGVGAELMLATVASLLWPLLPPGEVKSAVLTLAGVTWLTTFAVNANPFMRYDGYYILSDIWEIPGLQQRSFALARWWLREWLFGIGDPAPEALPAAVRCKLIVYAYATWLYRLMLFLGIALLVYHLFFKALGFFLMVVELVWFIGLPIWREIACWHSRRAALHCNWQAVRSILLAALLILLFIVPWHTQVQGTGILLGQNVAVMYGKQPAVVEAVLVTPGAHVVSGQTLLQLRSPDLEGRKAIAEQKLKALQEKLAIAGVDADFRSSYAIDRQELDSVASELAGINRDVAKLVLTAPIDGIWHDMPPWIQPGVWLPESMKLGTIVGSLAQITAYVPEEEVERLKVGAQGVFYPSSGLLAPVAVTLSSIDFAAVSEISHLELPATTSGGLIPVRKTSDGMFVPEQALYKITCTVLKGEHVPRQSVSGTVSLEGKRRSFIRRFWLAGMGIFIRESGWD